MDALIAQAVQPQSKRIAIKAEVETLESGAFEMWVMQKNEEMTNLCQDPPPLQPEPEPSCKELFHWYFQSLLTSRKLRFTDVFFPGKTQHAVLTARAGCGGMVLFKRISPAVQML